MFHFLLSEASCFRPIGARPSHCELRKLPPAGAWLREPAEAVRRFRVWIRAMRGAFPPGHKDAHLFGARSHGNERDPWCASLPSRTLVSLMPSRTLDEHHS